MKCSKPSGPSFRVNYLHGVNLDFFGYNDSPSDIYSNASRKAAKTEWNCKGNLLNEVKQPNPNEHWRIIGLPFVHHLKVFPLCCPGISINVIL